MLLDMKNHVDESGDAETVTDSLDCIVREIPEGMDPFVATASRRTLEASDWDDPSDKSGSTDANGL